MGALTFPGAWALQGINVARNPTMRSDADAVAGTIGLDGDAGATTQLPAGWVANRTAGTIVGTAGGDQALIGAANEAARAALLQTRVRFSRVFVVDPSVGATGTVGYFSTKNAAAPWRITVTSSGTNGGNADSEVWVEYLWSASAGR